MDGNNGNRGTVNETVQKNDYFWNPDWNIITKNGEKKAKKYQIKRNPKTHKINHKRLQTGIKRYVKLKRCFSIFFITGHNRRKKDKF